MKLTQLFLCSAALALPLTLNAATQKSDDRWFEVEIILFSQLGDKSQLKENFPDTSELPKHRRVEDLLHSYITPDIRGLKQLLPSCESLQYGESLVEKNAKLPPLFSPKSLVELAKVKDDTAEFNIANAPTEQRKTRFTDATSVSDVANNAALPATENIINKQPTFTDKTNKLAVNTAIGTDSLINAIGSSSLESNDLPFQTELSAKKRAQIQSLVRAAEVEFQALKFQYTPEVEFKLLCKMDEAHFADFQSSNPYFDYYGFTVDNIPLLIDGQEIIGNSRTHLLSKDSLQLDDVIKDLRYSKNFRPLLHMGWRQVARPEKLSVPVKIYAGENFAADHQKKLTRIDEQKSKQTAQLLADTNEQSSLLLASDKNQTEPLQSEKQARIEQVIAQLSQVSENTDELLASLEQQKLSGKLTDENTLSAKNTPLAPVQQWFIEGFFNIHLKHYLFITADFNILDKSLAELATAQLSTTTPINVNIRAEPAEPITAKAIRFKQNRRVISGEVHYFDHPYMGMVVQIRPYTQPESETETNN